MRETRDYTNNPDEFFKRFRDGRIYAIAHDNGSQDFYEHILTRQERSEELQKRQDYGKAVMAAIDADQERPPFPDFKPDAMFDVIPPKRSD